MVAFANPQAYELWMGRWSERLAPAFVDFADLAPGGRYLDVGAGTEQSGPDAGFPELFVNRWCILTPGDKASPDATTKLTQFSL